MSVGNINILLDLWLTSLFKHGDQPPFTSHWDLYDTIDVTPLGDVPWGNFSVHYNGIHPEGNVPSWMDTGHKVWYHNPRNLIHNISSALFKDDALSKVNVSFFTIPLITQVPDAPSLWVNQMVKVDAELKNTLIC